jgi:hypothetical protein
MKHALVFTLLLSFSLLAFGQIRPQKKDDPGDTGPKPLPPCEEGSVCSGGSCVPDTSGIGFGCCADNAGACETVPPVVRSRMEAGEVPYKLEVFGGEVEGYWLYRDVLTNEFTSLEVQPKPGSRPQIGLYVVSVERAPRLYSEKGRPIKSGDWLNYLSVVSKFEHVPARNLVPRTFEKR